MENNPKIATIIGTRPEIIKLSRLVPLLDKSFDHEFIFTSQHYSKDMVDIFFDELKLRQPDSFLEAKSSDYSTLDKKVSEYLNKSEAEYVVLYGDTNSTLAAARSAKSLGKKVIHLEAGLRSFDERMPEEKNRIATDKISDFLFSPTDLARNMLVSEGVNGKIFVVGNTIVDVCKFYSKKIGSSEIKKDIGSDKYFLLTAHRAENVDVKERLMQMLAAIGSLDEKVLFPIHPRTEKKMAEWNLSLPGNVIKTKPLGYFDFLSLLRDSAIALTDSGGVQEEAAVMHTPCLTLRESTERWETIINGGNFLVGLDPRLIPYYVKMIMTSELGARMRKAKNPYGDGRTSERIVEILKGEIL